MHFRIAGCATACILSVGCAHPYLKAGGNLATAVNKGTTAVSAVGDNEAGTYRAYLYVAQPKYLNTLMTLDRHPIKVAGDLESGFVGLACRPHADNELVVETVALDDLNKFQAFLTASATDPKDPTLASLIGDLRNGAQYAPTDFSKAVADLKTKRSKDADACITDVRTSFVTPPAAGFPPGATLLAAWPKISKFFTALLTEADKAAREQRIINALKDKDTRDTIDAALDALTTSAKTGQLSALVLHNKQLALWSAYDDYQHLAASSDDQRPKTFREAMEAATRMAAQLKAYDQIATTPLPDVVAKMQDAVKKLEKAVDTEKAPDDSVLAEILSAIQFLSDASSNYNDAASALNPSSSSSKTKK